MDDTISRQKAIDEIASIVSSMSVCVSMDECRGMKYMQERAIEKLKQLPPTDHETHH